MGAIPAGWYWCPRVLKISLRKSPAQLKRLMLLKIPPFLTPLIFSRAGIHRQGNWLFLFPGQGSQYLKMGKDLAPRFPEAGVIFDVAGPLFHREKSLPSFIYPDAAPEDKARKEVSENALRQTEWRSRLSKRSAWRMMKILSRFNVGRMPPPDTISVSCAPSAQEVGSGRTICSSGRDSGILK